MFCVYDFFTQTLQQMQTHVFQNGKEEKSQPNHF